MEVFANAPIEECEKRDVKGLYQMAREGRISNFTGISAPYEAPKNPDVTIKTEEVSVETAARIIVEKITPKLNLK